MRAYLFGFLMLCAMPRYSLDLRKHSATTMACTRLSMASTACLAQVRS